MKLLRITAEGLPLFKEKLEVSFYAQQRIAEEQKVFCIRYFQIFI